MTQAIIEGFFAGADCWKKFIDLNRRAIIIEHFLGVVWNDFSREEIESRIVEKLSQTDDGALFPWWGSAG
jgi:hypothetical protein